MELRFDLNSEDRKTASTLLRVSGRRECSRLVAGMAAGAALSLFWPFAADMHGFVRAALGVLLAGAGYLSVAVLLEQAERLRRYGEGAPVERDLPRGLETGPRHVVLSLSGFSERGPLGARRVAWSEVEDVIEVDGLIVLALANHDCLVLPRAALETAGLQDSALIRALVRDGRKRSEAGMPRHDERAVEEAVRG